MVYSFFASILFKVIFVVFLIFNACTAVINLDMDIRNIPFSGVATYDTLESNIKSLINEAGDSDTARIEQYNMNMATQISSGFFNIYNIRNNFSDKDIAIFDRSMYAKLRQCFKDRLGGYQNFKLLEGFLVKDASGIARFLEYVHPKTTQTGADGFCHGSYNGLLTIGTKFLCQKYKEWYQASRSTQDYSRFDTESKIIGCGLTYVFDYSTLFQDNIRKLFIADMVKFMDFFSGLFKLNVDSTNVSIIRFWEQWMQNLFIDFLTYSDISPTLSVIKDELNTIKKISERLPAATYKIMSNTDFISALFDEDLFPNYSSMISNYLKIQYTRTPASGHEAVSIKKLLYKFFELIYIVVEDFKNDQYNAFNLNQTVLSQTKSQLVVQHIIASIFINTIFADPRYSAYASNFDIDFENMSTAIFAAVFNGIEIQEMVNIFEKSCFRKKYDLADTSAEISISNMFQDFASALATRNASIGAHALEVQVAISSKNFVDIKDKFVKVMDDKSILLRDRALIIIDSILDSFKSTSLINLVNTRRTAINRLAVSMITGKTPASIADALIGQILGVASSVRTQPDDYNNLGKNIPLDTEYDNAISIAIILNDNYLLKKELRKFIENSSNANSTSILKNTAINIISGIRFSFPTLVINDLNQPYTLSPVILRIAGFLRSSFLDQMQSINDCDFIMDNFANIILNEDTLLPSHPNYYTTLMMPFMRAVHYKSIILSQDKTVYDTNANNKFLITNCPEFLKEIKSITYYLASQMSYFSTLEMKEEFIRSFFNQDVDLEKICIFDTVIPRVSRDGFVSASNWAPAMRKTNEMFFQELNDIFMHSIVNGWITNDINNLPDTILIDDFTNKIYELIQSIHFMTGGPKGMLCEGDFISVLAKSELFKKCIELKYKNALLEDRLHSEFQHKYIKSALTYVFEKIKTIGLNKLKPINYDFVDGMKEIVKVVLGKFFAPLDASSDSNISSLHTILYEVFTANPGPWDADRSILYDSNEIANLFIKYLVKDFQNISELNVAISSFDNIRQKNKVSDLMNISVSRSLKLVIKDLGDSLTSSYVLKPGWTAKSYEDISAEIVPFVPKYFELVRNISDLPISRTPILFAPVYADMTGTWMHANNVERHYDIVTVIHAWMQKYNLNIALGANPEEELKRCWLLMLRGISFYGTFDFNQFYQPSALGGTEVSDIEKAMLLKDNELLFKSLKTQMSKTFYNSSDYNAIASIVTSITDQITSGMTKIYSSLASKNNELQMIFWPFILSTKLLLEHSGLNSYEVQKYSNIISRFLADKALSPSLMIDDTPLTINLDDLRAECKAKFIEIAKMAMEYRSTMYKLNQDGSSTDPATSPSNLQELIQALLIYITSYCRSITSDEVYQRIEAIDFFNKINLLNSTIGIKETPNFDKSEFIQRYYSLFADMCISSNLIVGDLAVPRNQVDKSSKFWSDVNNTAYAFLTHIRYLDLKNIYLYSYIDCNEAFYRADTLYTLYTKQSAIANFEYLKSLDDSSHITLNKKAFFVKFFGFIKEIFDCYGLQTPMSARNNTSDTVVPTFNVAHIATSVITDSLKNFIILPANMNHKYDQWKDAIIYALFFGGKTSDEIATEFMNIFYSTVNILDFTDQDAVDRAIDFFIDTLYAMSKNNTLGKLSSLIEHDSFDDLEKQIIDLIRLLIYDTITLSDLASRLFVTIEPGLSSTQIATIKTQLKLIFDVCTSDSLKEQAAEYVTVALHEFKLSHSQPGSFEVILDKLLEAELLLNVNINSQTENLPLIVEGLLRLCARSTTLTYKQYLFNNIISKIFDMNVLVEPQITKLTNIIENAHVNGMVSDHDLANEIVNICTASANQYIPAIESITINLSGLSIKNSIINRNADKLKLNIKDLLATALSTDQKISILISNITQGVEQTFSTLSVSQSDHNRLEINLRYAIDNGISNEEIASTIVSGIFPTGGGTPNFIVLNEDFKETLTAIFKLNFLQAKQKASQAAVARDPDVIGIGKSILEYIKQYSAYDDISSKENNILTFLHDVNFYKNFGLQPAQPDNIDFNFDKIIISIAKSMLSDDWNDHQATSYISIVAETRDVVENSYMLMNKNYAYVEQLFFANQSKNTADDRLVDQYYKNRFTYLSQVYDSELKALTKTPRDIERMVIRESVEEYASKYFRGLTVLPENNDPAFNNQNRTTCTSTTSNYVIMYPIFGFTRPAWFTPVRNIGNVMYKLFHAYSHEPDSYEDVTDLIMNAFIKPYTNESLNTGLGKLIATADQRTLHLYIQNNLVDSFKTYVIESLTINTTSEIDTKVDAFVGKLDIEIPAINENAVKTALKEALRANCNVVDIADVITNDIFGQTQRIEYIDFDIMLLIYKKRGESDRATDIANGDHERIKLFLNDMMALVVSNMNTDISKSEQIIIDIMLDVGLEFTDVQPVSKTAIKDLIISLIQFNVSSSEIVGYLISVIDERNHTVAAGDLITVLTDEKNYMYYIASIPDSIDSGNKPTFILSANNLLNLQAFTATSSAMLVSGIDDSSNIVLSTALQNELTQSINNARSHGLPNIQIVNILADQLFGPSVDVNDIPHVLNVAYLKYSINNAKVHDVQNLPRYIKDALDYIDAFSQKALAQEESEYKDLASDIVINDVLGYTRITSQDKFALIDKIYVVHKAGVANDDIATILVSGIGATDIHASVLNLIQKLDDEQRNTVYLDPIYNAIITKDQNVLKAKIREVLLSNYGSLGSRIQIIVDALAKAETSITSDQKESIKLAISRLYGANGHTTSDNINLIAQIIFNEINKQIFSVDDLLFELNKQYYLQVLTDIRTNNQNSLNMLTATLDYILTLEDPLKVNNMLVNVIISVYISPTFTHGSEFDALIIALQYAFDNSITNPSIANIIIRNQLPLSGSGNTPTTQAQAAVNMKNELYSTAYEGKFLQPIASSIDTNDKTAFLSGVTNVLDTTDQNLTRDQKLSMIIDGINESNTLHNAIDNTKKQEIINLIHSIDALTMTHQDQRIVNTLANGVFERPWSVNNITKYLNVLMFNIKIEQAKLSPRPSDVESVILEVLNFAVTNTQEDFNIIVNDMILNNILGFQNIDNNTRHTLLDMMYSNINEHISLSRLRDIIYMSYGVADKDAESGKLVLRLNEERNILIFQDTLIKAIDSNASVNVRDALLNIMTATSISLDQKISYIVNGIDLSNRFSLTDAQKQAIGAQISAAVSAQVSNTEIIDTINNKLSVQNTVNGIDTDIKVIIFNKQISDARNTLPDTTNVKTVIKQILIFADDQVKAASSNQQQIYKDIINNLIVNRVLMLQTAQPAISQVKINELLNAVYNAYTSSIDIDEVADAIGDACTNDNGVKEQNVNTLIARLLADIDHLRYTAQIVTAINTNNRPLFKSSVVSILTMSYVSNIIRAQTLVEGIASAVPSITADQKNDIKTELIGVLNDNVPINDIAEMFAVKIIDEQHRNIDSIVIELNKLSFLKEIEQVRQVNGDIKPVFVEILNYAYTLPRNSFDYLVTDLIINKIAYFNGITPSQLNKVLSRIYDNMLNVDTEVIVDDIMLARTVKSLMQNTLYRSLLIKFVEPLKIKIANNDKAGFIVILQQLFAYTDFDDVDQDIAAVIFRAIFDDSVGTPTRQIATINTALQLDVANDTIINIIADSVFDTTSYSDMLNNLYYSMNIAIFNKKILNAKTADTAAGNKNNLRQVMKEVFDYAATFNREFDYENIIATLIISSSLDLDLLEKTESDLATSIYNAYANNIDVYRIIDTLLNQQPQSDDEATAKALIDVIKLLPLVDAIVNNSEPNARRAFITILNDKVMTSREIADTIVAGITKAGVVMTPQQITSLKNEIINVLSVGADVNKIVDAFSLGLFGTHQRDINVSIKELHIIYIEKKILNITSRGIAASESEIKSIIQEIIQYANAEVASISDQNVKKQTHASIIKRLIIEDLLKASYITALVNANLVEINKIADELVSTIYTAVQSNVPIVTISDIIYDGYGGSDPVASMKSINDNLKLAIFDVKFVQPVMTDYNNGNKAGFELNLRLAINQSNFASDVIVTIIDKIFSITDAQEKDVKIALNIIFDHDRNRNTQEGTNKIIQILTNRSFETPKQADVMLSELEIYAYDLLVSDNRGSPALENVIKVILDYVDYKSQLLSVQGPQAVKDEYSRLVYFSIADRVLGLSYVDKIKVQELIDTMFGLRQIGVENANIANVIFGELQKSETSTPQIDKLTLTNNIIKELNDEKDHYLYIGPLVQAVKDKSVFDFEIAAKTILFEPSISIATRARVFTEGLISVTSGSASQQSELNDVLVKALSTAQVTYQEIIDVCIDEVFDTNKKASTTNLIINLNILILKKQALDAATNVSNRQGVIVSILDYAINSKSESLFISMFKELILQDMFGVDIINTNNLDSLARSVYQLINSKVMTIQEVASTIIGVSSNTQGNTSFVNELIIVFDKLSRENVYINQLANAIDTHTSVNSVILSILNLPTTKLSNLEKSEAITMGIERATSIVEIPMDKLSIIQKSIYMAIDNSVSSSDIATIVTRNILVNSLNALTSTLPLGLLELVIIKRISIARQQDATASTTAGTEVITNRQKAVEDVLTLAVNNQIITVADNNAMLIFKDAVSIIADYVLGFATVPALAPYKPKLQDAVYYAHMSGMSNAEISNIFAPYIGKSITVTIAQEIINKFNTDGSTLLIKNSMSGTNLDIVELQRNIKTVFTTINNNDKAIDAIFVGMESAGFIIPDTIQDELKQYVLSISNNNLDNAVKVIAANILFGDATTFLDQAKILNDLQVINNHLSSTNTWNGSPPFNLATLIKDKIDKELMLNYSPSDIANDLVDRMFSAFAPPAKTSDLDLLKTIIADSISSMSSDKLANLISSEYVSGISASVFANALINKLKAINDLQVNQMTNLVKTFSKPTTPTMNKNTRVFYNRRIKV